MARGSRNEHEEPVLQEKLALQRTILANVTTFLSFLRTSMYFLVAGLSVRSLLDLGENDLIHIILYILSAIIFVLGVVNYFIHKKRIRRSKDRIGEYRKEYRHEE